MNRSWPLIHWSGSWEFILLNEKFYGVIPSISPLHLFWPTLRCYRYHKSEAPPFFQNTHRLCLPFYSLQMVLFSVCAVGRLHWCWELLGPVRYFTEVLHDFVAISGLDPASFGAIGVGLPRRKHQLQCALTGKRLTSRDIEYVTFSKCSWHLIPKCHWTQSLV